jgi:phage terminase Nu1 subunit (DNA packaging protein)
MHLQALHQPRIRERPRNAITDVRAQQAYVAQYVAERQAAYQAEPARRQKEEWKSRARAQLYCLRASSVKRELTSCGRKKRYPVQKPVL